MVKKYVGKPAKRIIEFIIGILAPLILLLIWQLAADNGWMNKSVLPSVKKVVETGIKITASGKLPSHLGASFERVLIGFAIGAGLGLILGILMGLSPFLHKFLSSLVNLLRPVPMIAWIPIFILWFGIGEITKVFVIALGSFWPVLLNTISGIKSVDTKLLEVTKVLNKNKITVLTKVILPGAIPSIFTGIRLGIGAAWSCVVAAEMIAATRGVGFMITYARETAKPGEVFVGVIIIGVIGLLIDLVVRRIEKRLLKWNTEPKS